MSVLTFQEEQRPISGSRTQAPRIDPGLMPRLTTTVPREYVHRSSHAEVFLTACEKNSATRYTLAGQWPRAHTFFTSPDGMSHDPLQAAETIRQVGLFLAHAEFGVPLGHQFLLWDIYVNAHPEQMTIGPGPSELTLVTTVTDMKQRGRRLSEFALEVRIMRGESLCAVGGGRFTCLSPATYRRLRGQPNGLPPRRRVQAQASVLPRTMGKLLPMDVVLSPTDNPRRWLLDPDPGHPILFDHSGDHIPGMVLLEAARQAACALLNPSVLRVSSACADFQRYAEFDTPCWIEASLAPSEADDKPSVLVTGRQGGHVIFTAHLSGEVSLPGGSTDLAPVTATR